MRRIYWFVWPTYCTPVAMDSLRDGVVGRMRLPFAELKRPVDRGELWGDIWGRDGRVILRFHSARSADSSRLT